MVLNSAHGKTAHSRLWLLAAALVAGLSAVLLLVATAAASPSQQQGPPHVDYVEPDTLQSETGGTLTIHGSGFTATTSARLVGFGLLNTTYVNDTWLNPT